MMVEWHTNRKKSGRCQMSFERCQKNYWKSFLVLCSVDPHSPLSARGEGGVKPLTKNWELDRSSIFRGRCCERGSDLFLRGCNFYIKNKLKSEIISDKNYKQKYFALP